ncbi:MAG: D-alanyl-D-alanine carboxypeptidase/D-alanyl-D-alanine-endopeptidase [Gammaproteobacteria bacterium]|nr:D-alanyl-D-alanine carboxypeptidase/D-alanyl-D-alanine-endopeptidase [Gammaproteobacteria bacterium]
MPDCLRYLFASLLMALLVCHGATQAAEEALPAGVRSALQVRQVPQESLSVHIEDVDTGEVVLTWLPEEPRNPASTMKLLTTLVALDVLGPAYRWKTDIYALGVIEDGILDGDLLLKGYGDPFLVTERVWQMLRGIRHSGIDNIAGDLLLDDSYFDIGEYDPAAFDKQPLRAYNVAPNALLMNFKVVRYWFEPDGQSVAVRLDPQLGNLGVDNRLQLVPGYCGGYQRGITVTNNGDNDHVTFSGRFPKGCKRYAMDRTVLSHNEFAYGLFSSLWRDSGGAFDGGWRKAVAPEDMEPVFTFESPSLTEMIASVNKHSNNVMARQVLYTLAAEVLGPPGTEMGGRKVIGKWLSDNGLEPAELAVANGAGLSRESRITAVDMSSLLRFAWQQPYMPEYLASMSLTGLDGTLSRRFRGGELVGKAHLKTGSLDHVTAIAGYLQARSGRRFSVVVLHNFEDIHRGPGEEVQEALLRWLYEQ